MADDGQGHEPRSGTLAARDALASDKTADFARVQGRSWERDVERLLAWLAAGNPRVEIDALLNDVRLRLHESLISRRFPRGASVTAWAKGIARNVFREECKQLGLEAERAMQLGSHADEIAQTKDSDRRAALEAAEELECFLSEALEEFSGPRRARLEAWLVLNLDDVPELEVLRELNLDAAERVHTQTAVARLKEISRDTLRKDWLPEVDAFFDRLQRRRDHPAAGG